VVAADPMVVVAEDGRASTRPRPRGRPPWPHQQSSDASRGSETNDPSARRSRRRLSSSDTSVPPGAEELLAAPLPLSKGRGRGGGTGSHGGGLGASSRRIGDPDPAVGFPVVGLVNRHIALVEGRQRDQDRCPQP
jgi:hypothetical protein